jgi:anaerobic selenocysteine-containing dehydrogenase
MRKRILSTPEVRMSTTGGQRIPAFCPLCASRCGCEGVVEDGRLVAIEPDPTHPTGKALCAKGRAGPELVQASDRLLYPMRRTRPKGDPDPGWQRISWDQALDETAAALRRIAAESGPEAVAFGVTTSSGTALSDAQPWVDRLVNAFGSPNNCNSWDLCAWHRTFARALTTGTHIGTPDYAGAGCILLWGHNPGTSLLAAATRIARARAQGAKLIVVDPRHAGFAVKADCWLQVRPGTDAAVALAIAGEMIGRGCVDFDFVRNWSNGPFLVRDSDGALLRAEALDLGGTGFVAWDEGRDTVVRYDPNTRGYDQAPIRLALSGRVTLVGRDGPIACRPAFDVFSEQCRAMTPEIAAGLSGVEPDQIRAAARLMWEHRPVAHNTWTGLEQHANATQTDRSIAILHALTGSIDVPGGNVHFAQVPVNDVSGNDLREPAQWNKALGLDTRPLGMGRNGWILSDDLYRAAIDGDPYRVRAFVGFGLNLLLSHPNGARGAEALRRMEFHVHSDLYLTPTASFADILLPIASAWEREGLRLGFGLDQDACELIQLRPALTAPRGEARPDIDIVFDLAVRLGLGDRFWNGDVDAALDHQLAPSGLTVRALRARSRGIRVPLKTAHQKYRDTGFATSSGKVEIFSSALHAIGEAPFPVFRPPLAADGFPLTLTTIKTPHYCHSQHRNLASLRRLEPDPIAELSHQTACSRGISDGDWMSIVTPHGRVRVRARLSTTLSDDVVAARHGWWQACPELGLPGYDALDPDGANVNLAIGVDRADPVSGVAAARSYPCQIERAD